MTTENKKQSLSNQADSMQQMQAAKRHLQQEFMQIMQAKPSQNLQWKGTKTDLFELTYDIFLDGIVVDNRGCPATYTWLVNYICNILHVDVPSNPRSYTNKAHARKGFRQKPFIERYCFMMFNSNISDPLHESITVA